MTLNEERDSVLAELRRHDYALRPIEIAERCQMPLKRVWAALRWLQERELVCKRRLSHDCIVNDGGSYVIETGIGFKAVVEKRK